MLDLVHGAKSTQGVEIAEGGQQLGLVMLIPVVAGRRVPRHAREVLALEAE